MQEWREALFFNRHKRLVFCAIYAPPPSRCCEMNVSLAVSDLESHLHCKFYLREENDEVIISSGAKDPSALIYLHNKSLKAEHTCSVLTVLR